MRRKSEALLAFEGNDGSLPKVVRQEREKYKGISRMLDAHPEILDAVHEDLKRLSTEGGGFRRGRGGDFTSETILRALILHAVEGLSLRDTVIRIAESPFLQDFIRTRKLATMDFTFLDRCLLAIPPSTWKRVNALLAKAALAANKIDPATVRADTTVVEANIHHPTDSSLLWDVWRVASRWLKRARKIDRQSVPHRFHGKKIKRLHLTITRFIKSKSPPRQREVRRSFRTLIERTGWIVTNVVEFCTYARNSVSLELAAIADELEAMLPTMTQVVAQATRAQVQGERVPAAERVFSIFEPHTELIMRGRREKPVEFGHKMLLVQTPEKFISDYEVYEKQVADCNLTKTVIERHEALFGTTPEVLAADKGFCPDAEEYARLEKQVGTLAIPKRLRDFADALMGAWQAFRAGIEGTISGLKRAFRLSRCFYRHYNGFARAIGLGVLSHNLLVLSKLKTT
jgi:IS5 family transposase